MKVCITAQGNTLDADLDPRFGRCKYFMLVDPETFQFEALQNPNLDATGGAGIQSGQLMASNQVNVVITGNVGPNAFQTLQAAKINIITGASGSLRSALEQYKQGKLRPATSPSVNSKFGLPGKEF
jgi:predicted Fe-Mo cluster-binding NifX family protein